MNTEKGGAEFRIRDFSWWDLELPTKEEMQRGIEKLKNVDYNVDYIISHCAPTSVQALISSKYDKNYFTDYLQKIYEKTKFKKWYFGHYHNTYQLNEQFIMLYEDIVLIK